jgi:hypothetical protein
LKPESRHGAWTRVAVIGLSLVIPVTLSGYAVNTGITPGCHERMTQNAMNAFFAQEGSGVNFSDVQLPSDNLWEIVAEHLVGFAPAANTDRNRSFVETSILLGARWPDTRGNPVTSLDALYAAHGDIADQQEHCLRKADHTGDNGNALALQETRSFLRERIRMALSYRQRPPAEQIISVNEYIELYGTVPLRLHAVGFYLGTAIHTLQDCFSHTLRSDDLHRIRQVLNFVDAATPHYRESRDGLPHSHVMDNCDDRRTIPIQLAAERSVRQLLGVLLADSDAAAESILDTLMQDWMERETGCDITNNYCDSRWLPLIREGPVLPFSSCNLQVGVGHRKSSLLGLLPRLW